MIWKKKKQRELNADDSILLQLKKIRDIDNLNEFLEPPVTYEHSAFDLENIDFAVQRIIKAISLQEKIAIQSDTDADGICSCSIMYNYLRQLTENISIVHAQRSCGHGVETIIKELQEELIENVKYFEEDTQLLIIVDSSSNSVEGCQIIKEKYGCDIVIIDHHNIDKENPYATIVNCQLGDYPNKNASGSAMCYKVLQVLDGYMDLEQADEYLDLVAIGLVADLMSLEERENRSLINRGMKTIRNEGLASLLKVNNIDFYYGITSQDIGFKISPLINASARYDRMELALELFTENDVDRAKEIAKELKKLNEHRKQEEKEIVESVINKVDNTHKVAVVIDNDIDSNFRGLICMQLTSKLKKPAFVLTFNEEKNEYYGSARSVGQINLQDLCNITGDFIYCQGHEKAFGLGIKGEKLEQALETLDELIENSDSEELLEYDIEIEAKDITRELIIEVEKFSKITGHGFPQPRFLVKGLVLNEVEMLGKKAKETVKLSCENELVVMKFRVNEEFAEPFEQALENEDSFFVEFDCIGTLNLNKYYHFGKKEWQYTNQIFMEDYKIHG